MPIYEYWCHRCHKKMTVFMASFSDKSPSCPECSQDSLARLFSTFSVRKDYHSVYDDILSDSQLTRGIMQSDPKSLAEWNRRMSGGERPAAEYEDMVGKMEKGEMPPAPSANNSAPAEGESR